MNQIRTGDLRRGDCGNRTRCKIHAMDFGYLSSNPHSRAQLVASQPSRSAARPPVSCQLARPLRGTRSYRFSRGAVQVSHLESNQYFSSSMDYSIPPSGHDSRCQDCAAGASRITYALFQTASHPCIMAAAGLFHRHLPASRCCGECAQSAHLSRLSPAVPLAG